MASRISAGVIVILLISLVLPVCWCSVILYSDFTTSLVGRNVDWMND